jgi:hypothetical protein
MINERFKRSAFHRWFGLYPKAEKLGAELQELLNKRLQSAEDTVHESRQIIVDLKAQGHRLVLSEPDSDTDLQVWVDGDFAVWFWADSTSKDVTKRIDRIEVLWQKM